MLLDWPGPGHQHSVALWTLDTHHLSLSPSRQDMNPAEIRRGVTRLGLAYQDIIVGTRTGDVPLTCPRQNNNDVLSPIQPGYIVMALCWHQTTNHGIVQQGKLSYHLVPGYQETTTGHGVHQLNVLLSSSHKIRTFALINTRY